MLLDCDCRYLGVTVIERRPVVAMKLYSGGCLAAVIEATDGMGLEVQKALRWGSTPQLALIASGS
jgi:hypothetical protein